MSSLSDNSIVMATILSRLGTFRVVSALDHLRTTARLAVLISPVDLRTGSIIAYPLPNICPQPMLVD